MSLEHAYFFRDFAYVFLAAVIGGLLARRLRQPVILGYVLGGMIIGPFTPGIKVTDLQFLELLAEFGVILLMYSIGIEFSFRDLLRVGRVSLLGGPFGILLSIGLSVGVGHVMAWPLLQSVTIGAVISVASTMVLSRLLIDRGELHSRHGSVMIGITLVEDIAVVFMTILLPALATLGDGRIWNITFTLGKSLLLLVPVALAAYYLVPRIMTWVARTRSDELYFLVALALGLLTAAASQAIGLSLALGAFLAGMVISESEYAHQTLAQLLPMRNAFVALFFVTIGMLIDPASLFSNLPLLGAFVGLVIVGKFLIWAVVVLVFGYGLWTAVLVGVGLTQIGEFSFILIQVARGAGLVGDDVYNATLATSLITIVINAVLIKVAPNVIGKLRMARERLGTQPPQSLRTHVVICGFGRVGSTVGTALEHFKIPYAVIEVDPDIVKALRARSIHAVYGDPSHSTILKEACIEDAALVVITIPELERASVVARSARAANSNVSILARAHRLADRELLLGNGATEIILPELEASVTFVRHALAQLNIPAGPVNAYTTTFRQAIELAHSHLHPGDALVPVVADVELPHGDGSLGTIAEHQIRQRYGVTVLSVARAAGHVISNPMPDTQLVKGDVLQVFGLPEQIDSFRKSLSP